MEDKQVGRPNVGGPFNLTTHQGKPFSEKDLLGKWSLIYFGFTNCPDICPEELDKMGEAVEELGASLLHYLTRIVAHTCAVGSLRQGLWTDRTTHLHFCRPRAGQRFAGRKICCGFPPEDGWPDGRVQGNKGGVPCVPCVLLHTS